MGQLPQDPIMLYSVINTKLRDFYSSLEVLCEDMGLSEEELKEKLSSEFEEHTIEKVLDFLRNNKFIDDKLLAQKIVNTNINLNKCGKNKIKQNLYNKGIESEDISHAISNINSNVEFENAMYLAKKRYERIKNEDKRKIYQKLSQHLAYKGFGYDTIKSVLNKILNFDEYEY